MPVIEVSGWISLYCRPVTRFQEPKIMLRFEYRPGTPSSFEHCRDLRHDSSKDGEFRPVGPAVHHSTRRIDTSRATMNAGAGNPSLLPAVAEDGRVGLSSSSLPSAGGLHGFSGAIRLLAAQRSRPESGDAQNGAERKEDRSRYGH